MTDSERITKLKDYVGVSYNKLAQIIGINSAQTLYDIRNGRHSISKDLADKITTYYLDINRVWLLTGEGEMLKTAPTQTINQQGANNPIGNVNGNVVYGEDTSCPRNCPDRLPIVPTTLATRPEFDILPYMANKPNDVELSSVRVDHTPITMWYRITDTSLEPKYNQGDLIALHAYPQGQEDPIPGKLYAVDTMSNGIVLRILLPTDGGYIARAINTESFPDFVIKKENIIRIYRKMLMVRF